MIRTLITTILSFNTIQDLILYFTSEIDLDCKNYVGFLISQVPRRQVIGPI